MTPSRRSKSDRQPAREGGVGGGTVRCPPAADPSRIDSQPEKATSVGLTSSATNPSPRRGDEGSDRDRRWTGACAMMWSFRSAQNERPTANRQVGLRNQQLNETISKRRQFTNMTMIAMMATTKTTAQTLTPTNSGTMSHQISLMSNQSSGTAKTAMKSTTKTLIMSFMAFIF